jgi:hypothetical protein
LFLIKKQRDEKAALKKARAERKPFPKRQPITPDIYERLIQAVRGKNYRSARF